METYTKLNGISVFRLALVLQDPGTYISKTFKVAPLWLGYVGTEMTKKGFHLSQTQEWIRQFRTRIPLTVCASPCAYQEEHNINNFEELKFDIF